jgi:hypothetical protein
LRFVVFVVCAARVERREAAETGEGQQPRIQDDERRRGRRRRDMLARRVWTGGVQGG